MTSTDRHGPPRLRTDAERDAFGPAVRYARVHGLTRPPESAYLEALPEARREICRRLVGGLLRGRPAGLPNHRVVGAEPDALPDEPAPLAALTADRLRSLVASLPARYRWLALLPFPTSESVLVAPVAARHGYDRYRLAGPLYQWPASERSGATQSREADAKTEIGHPIDLVPLLEREGAFSDAEQADRIRTELAESVANLALARLAEDVQADAVGQVSVPEDGSPLERVATGVPAADRATAFERIVTGGHPFHPAGKLRRGMTAADGLAYAPEFTARIDLRFVAIDRRVAKETRAREVDADSLTDRLIATFAGLDGALERAVPAGRDPAGYAVVPVHPLQFHRTIPDRYADRIADGRVVPIPDYTRRVTPQLNLRTVVPYESEAAAVSHRETTATDGPLPHLKLAVSVQTTNVVRTLSPHAVTNGPQVTDILRAIDQRESFETLGILGEPAATCYDPPDGPHPDGDGFDDARHLSGLVRTNPAAHRLVPEGAVPVVAASLVADAPTTGRPLVREVIDRYGTAMDLSSPEAAALAFLEQYAAVVVPEQLRLLCPYGIALESHLQNSLIVFDESTARPLATLVRDLGGIRVHRGRLGEHGRSFEPYPDSDVDAETERELYRKLYYALFQNHLGELVATISDELALDERVCWRRIRTQCEQAFETLRSDPGVPGDRVRRDERALFDDTTVHKALTAMRLRGKRHEYVTSTVSNPLSRSGRRSDR
ncbi:IucA/IucC family protein [Halopiger djelfimassiliensis]|uniref:IucA/IucC family protein n=1 Tax=Halopiger djelfimassiliensis TaxID=1293047 RepID=UPI00067810F0|nr:IucA/IucC family protein [Halopiger djelfimassiliensis]